MIADKAEKAAVKSAVREECTDVEWEADFGADYVAGGYVVERKKWHEIPERMMNNENNLFMQLAKTQNAAEELGKDPVLLLEGDILGATSHTQISTDAIQKYVAGAFELGINVMTTLDEEHTAVVLEKWDTPSSSPDVRPIRDPPKVPDGERPRYLVEGLPGVGPKTAEALLAVDGFDCACDVFSASEEKLQKAEGVGPATAEKIVAAATEAYE